MGPPTGNGNSIVVQLHPALLGSPDSDALRPVSSDITGCRQFSAAAAAPVGAARR
ncbi:hypothetical protein [Nocardia sp. NPDC049707]|uniref:hypothetical protein n=1 Tax=Nocardia sp. NPDC049707 TaxID=3154735 RepID=UPI0034444438